MDDVEAYEVLDIQSGASHDEVRDAYRRMAKEHHPDVSDAPDAEERFVRIRDAYETLRDAPETGGGAAEGDGPGSDGVGGDGARTRKRERGWTRERRASTRENVDGTRRERSTRETDTRSAASWATRGGSGDADRADKRDDRRAGGRRRHWRAGTQEGSVGERVEGLRGGWEIRRDVVDDGVDWYVYHSRTGNYLDGSAERSTDPHVFRSRSAARKKHSELRNRKRERRREREGRRRAGGFDVVKDIDGKWRLGRGDEGFVVVSRGPPFSYLDASGDVSVESVWFDSAEEAREAYDERMGRVAPGMDGIGRLVLLPFLIPLAMVFGVLSDGDASATDYGGKRKYIAWALTTAVLLSLALVSTSALGTVIFSAIALVSMIVTVVLVLSPYSPG